MGLEDELARSRKVVPDDRNAAGRAPKAALPFLRVFASSHGNQGIPYAGMLAMREDSEFTGGKVTCGCVAVYYKMLLVEDGRETFGFWKMTIKGEGLDLLGAMLASHKLPTLNPGVNDMGMHPFTVESIVFEPFEPEGQED